MIALLNVCKRVAHFISIVATHEAAAARPRSLHSHVWRCHANKQDVVHTFIQERIHKERVHLLLTGGAVCCRARAAVDVLMGLLLQRACISMLRDSNNPHIGNARASG